MCALVTPIIKSNYKLYPGMPVARKSGANSAKLPSNNYLSVPKQGRIRSTSNVSAQSNPEISVTSISNGNTNYVSGHRHRNSVSVSQITRDRDDIRREKLQQILEEKERQRKISSTSDDPSNGSSSPPSNKNRFAKLLKHFGIKKSRPKSCERDTPPLASES